MPILALVSQGSISPGLADDASAAWGEMGVTWFGPDGSVWDLASPDSGVVLVPGGVRGLNMPPITRYTGSSPALPGSRWQGSRVGERPVFWPLLVHSEVGSQGWIDTDRDFWSTMRPDDPGTWRITLPDGTYRELTCRFDDDGDATYDLDPIKVGWAAYGVSLVADDQPFWLGRQQGVVLGAGSGSNFFSSSGSVLTISPSQTISSANVSNPGDVPAWPRWTVNGPADSIVLGVAGGAVTYAPALSAGQSVTIDTDPAVMTATNQAGVDVTSSCTWLPQPIPPGASVPLAISMTPLSSAASVEITLTPRYYRAW